MCRICRIRGTDGQTSEPHKISNQSSQQCEETEFSKEETEKATVEGKKSGASPSARDSRRNREGHQTDAGQDGERLEEGSVTRRTGEKTRLQN